MANRDGLAVIAANLQYEGLCNILRAVFFDATEEAGEVSQRICDIIEARFGTPKLNLILDEIYSHPALK
ncbi:hypothetical protein LPW36_02135 [Jinshanibacter sp. LJY008]|uniref:Uncharacterized protein n=1 Tax=Limnobaculum eriocheiris TaxID=2897391 RepID=A0A9X1MTP7_9GAMM|nr:hypothetical protein [Limnobaculum eriocheiris]MCD1124844.1 hypothetical protein [Limnobaculum eriocheiris]